MQTMPYRARELFRAEALDIRPHAMPTEDGLQLGRPVRLPMHIADFVPAVVLLDRGRRTPQLRLPSARQVAPIAALDMYCAVHLRRGN